MLVESWHEIYYRSTNAGSSNVNHSNTKRGIGSGTSNTVGIYGISSNGYKVPSIVGAGKNHHRRKGKVKRCCEVAAFAVQVVISAVLGDPSAIIAGVIGSFISR
jgi:hypothetical protein